jgi:hypothetical protein
MVRMSSAACLFLKVGRPLWTIIGIGFETRRCDRSFVLTVPMPTYRHSCPEQILIGRMSQVGAAWRRILRYGTEERHSYDRNCRG